MAKCVIMPTYQVGIGHFEKMLGRLDAFFFFFTGEPQLFFTSTCQVATLLCKFPRNFSSLQDHVTLRGSHEGWSTLKIEQRDREQDQFGPWAGKASLFCISSPSLLCFSYSLSGSSQTSCVISLVFSVTTLIRHSQEVDGAQNELLIPLGATLEGTEFLWDSSKFPQNRVKTNSFLSSCLSMCIAIIVALSSFSLHQRPNRSGHCRLVFQPPITELNGLSLAAILLWQQQLRKWIRWVCEELSTLFSRMLAGACSEGKGCLIQVSPSVTPDSCLNLFGFARWQRSCLPSEWEARTQMLQT